MASIKFKNEQGEWEKVDLGEQVATFNGRYGDVAPQAGDYTADMVGAAPAGFGLGARYGKRLYATDDLNDVRETGWYFWGAEHPQNAPDCIVYNDGTTMPINYAVMRVDTYGDAVCHQTVISNEPYSNAELKRTQSLGSQDYGFEKWGIDNPVFSKVCEYRTNERMRGNAVWKRLRNDTIEYRLEDETEWKPYAKAVGGLALDGSNAMTGRLVVPALSVTTTNLPVEIGEYLDFSVNGEIDYSGRLRMSAEGELHLTPIGGTEKTILHTGNKPSGSYTGNGSAERREIPVSALGKVVAIWSDHGTALIVNSVGYGRINSGLKDIAGGNVFVSSTGNLILSTTENLLNANGVTYNYQFL